MFCLRLQILPTHVADHWRIRCGEHERLTRVGGGAVTAQNYVLNSCCETHIQHEISFVQNKPIYEIQRDALIVNKVQNAARRAGKDVDLGGELGKNRKWKTLYVLTFNEWCMC